MSDIIMNLIYTGIGIFLLIILLIILKKPKNKSLNEEFNIKKPKNKSLNEELNIEKTEIETGSNEKLNIEKTEIETGSNEKLNIEKTEIETASNEETEIKTDYELVQKNEKNDYQKEQEKIEKLIKHLKRKTFNGEILVAEDNLINQKLIKKVFESMHLNVDLANDGLIAFNKRKEKDYSFILMDISMPNMGGTEATKSILKWEKENDKDHVPIIAITANALKGDREMFLSKGLDEYITKPIKLNKLKEILEKFWGKNVIAQYIESQIYGNSLKNNKKQEPNIEASVTKEFKEEFKLKNKVDFIECGKYNTQRAIEEFNLNDSELKEYLKDLKQQINDELSNLQEGIQTSNIDLLKKSIHKLKGSSVNLGENGIAKLLYDYNEYLSSGENDINKIYQYYRNMIYYASLL